MKPNSFNLAHRNIADGIAVDWVHDLLFISDVVMNRIEVGNLTFGNRRVIVHSNIFKPGSLLIHPKYGFGEFRLRPISTQTMDVCPRCVTGTCVFILILENFSP